MTIWVFFVLVWLFSCFCEFASFSHFFNARTLISNYSFVWPNAGANPEFIDFIASSPISNWMTSVLSHFLKRDHSQCCQTLGGGGRHAHSPDIIRILCLYLSPCLLLSPCFYGAYALGQWPVPSSLSLIWGQ